MLFIRIFVVIYRCFIRFYVMIFQILIYIFEVSEEEVSGVKG